MTQTGTLGVLAASVAVGVCIVLSAAKSAPTYQSDCEKAGGHEYRIRHESLCLKDGLILEMP